MAVDNNGLYPRFSSVRTDRGVVTIFTDYMPYVIHMTRRNGAGGLLSKLFICGCGKTWEEGDLFEEHGGKACQKCTKLQKQINPDAEVKSFDVNDRS